MVPLEEGAVSLAAGWSAWYRDRFFHGPAPTGERKVLPAKGTHFTTPHRALPVVFLCWEPQAGLPAACTLEVRCLPHKGCSYNEVDLI